MEERLATLRMVRGQRTTPPPAQYLPCFGRFTVCAEAGPVLHVVPAHE